MVQRGPMQGTRIWPEDFKEPEPGLGAGLRKSTSERNESDSRGLRARNQNSKDRRVGIGL